MALDLFDKAVMKLDIALMLRQHANQAGAEAPGFVNARAGFYAEGFVLIARKVGVEIDIQPAQAQCGYGIIAHGHSSFYDSGRYRSTDFEE